MSGKRPRWLENWLQRHQTPVSFWLHVVGIPLTIAAVVLAGYQLCVWRWDLWWRPVVLLAVGYAVQIIGHWYEGNELGEVIGLKRLLGRPYVAVSPRGSEENRLREVMDMYRYDAVVVWRDGKEGAIRAATAPEIRVGTPPEFGGPSGVWSPEQLLVASVGGCLMTTFLFFAERSAIHMHSYNSTAEGRMEKTPNGLRFTAFDVAIAVEVEAKSDAEKTRALQSKLEKYCPISASVQCPVTLHLDVAAREGR